LQRRNAELEQLYNQDQQAQRAALHTNAVNTMLVDACVDAARRIMTELLARRAGAPQGRA
jgi:hypothetical protein